MKAEELLNLLEETAERLGVKLDYDDVRKGVVTSYGDAYTLRGERRILVEKSLDTGERADILIKILAKFDTEEIFLAPEVRKRLNHARIDEEKRLNRESTEALEASSPTPDNTPDEATTPGDEHTENAG